MCVCVCVCVCCFQGVLLRKLEAGLLGVSHVVVDEVHERDINVSGELSDWEPCTFSTKHNENA